MSEAHPSKGNKDWKKGMRSPNPKGRPRKDKGSREDGWTNLLTGLGTTRDKRTGAAFASDIVDDATARDLWLGNDIAARIIETIPHEMLRAGWDLRIKTDEDGDEDASDALDDSEEITTICEELGIEDALERALQYERAYGGAAILPIVNDGSDMTTEWDQPLDLERIIELSHFVVLEPRECLANTWQGDLTLPNFGEPETYRVAPITRGTVAPPNIIVHESRLIIFRGIRVSRHQIQTARPSWGGSMLTRVNLVLRDFGVAWESVGAIMQDFSQAVFTIDGLAQILAQDDKKAFQNRMSAMDMARSILRAIVIDSKDGYERKPTPLSGIPETLDKFSTRLAAAADMPVTLLMGMSPAGLNATGESDRAFFYDRVQRLQQVKLKPHLERILKILFKAKSLGPDKKPGGLEPEVWSVQFRPLWQPTAKEQAETRWLVAQADAAYLDRGVTLPQEVALSRFGGDQYSDRTQIDTQTRKQILEIEIKQQLEEAKNPPEPGAQPAQGEPDAANEKTNGKTAQETEAPPAAA